jgi:hypothetical protein
MRAVHGYGPCYTLGNWWVMGIEPTTLGTTNQYYTTKLYPQVTHAATLAVRTAYILRGKRESYPRTFDHQDVTLVSATKLLPYEVMTGFEPVGKVLPTCFPDKRLRPLSHITMHSSKRIRTSDVGVKNQCLATWLCWITCMRCATIHAVGIEPTTIRLKVECSTTELCMQMHGIHQYCLEMESNHYQRIFSPLLYH